MGRDDGLLGDWRIMFYLGIGGLFFAGMALFVLLITGFLTLGKGESLAGETSVVVFGVCFVICLIPGLLCIFIGLRGRRKERELERVAELLEAYRRIKISELACKMGLTEFAAEQVIADCLDQELVDGYIDRSTGEFFTKEAMGQALNIEKCPRCGVPDDRLRLVGEEVKCGSCGSIMSG